MKLKQKPEDFMVKEISKIEPGKEGSYAYFLLKKRDYTTLKALQQIAVTLSVPLKWLGYAGNKDKVAVTEQVCSAATITPERLKEIKLKDIEITVLGQGNKPISLGDLKGNKFEIIARDIDKLPEKKTRFKNFFGEQRLSTNNAAIGKAIVKREFKQAVALILATKSPGSQDIHKSMIAQPKNYLAALKTLPIKMLKLYVHAYQSVLWNELAKNTTKTKLQIVGFDTTPDKELEELLKREEITVRGFVIKEFPELSSEGTEREVYAEASDLVMGGLEDDELNQGKKKVKLTFTLPPGSYATEFVRQLFT